MRGRLATIGIAVMLIPVLLGCDPTPPPDGFEVTDPGVVLASSESHVLVKSSDGTLWSAGMGGGGVDRFDPASGLHTSTVVPDAAVVADLLAGPNGAVIAAVWTPDLEGGDPLDSKVLRIGPDMSVDVLVELGPGSLAFGLAHDRFTGFWVSDGLGERVMRVPFAGGPVDEFALPDGVRPSALVATGQDTVWFVPADRPGLGRLDTLTGYVEVQPAPSQPRQSFSMSLIVGPGGELWYTYALGEGLFRFDRETGATVEIPVGELWPRDLVVGADRAVYATLSCGIDDGLLRVDPVTLATTTYDIGFSSSRQTSLGSLVRDGDGLWVTVHPDAEMRHLVPIGAAPT